MSKSFFRNLLLERVHEEQRAMKYYLDVSSEATADRFAEEYALRESIIRILETTKYLNSVQIFALLVTNGVLSKLSDAILCIDYEGEIDDDVILGCIIAESDLCAEILHDYFEEE